MKDFGELPDQWTLILTRPSGGVVGKFGEPWAHCPPEFPRVNMYRHPPQSMPTDQVRSILTANGIDPDVYERAQQLLREALRGNAVAPATPEQAKTIPAEVVEPLNAPAVIPAELVTPMGEEVVNGYMLMATTALLLPDAVAKTDSEAPAQCALF